MAGSDARLQTMSDIELLPDEYVFSEAHESARCGRNVHPHDCFASSRLELHET
jgi:hypothetical protein